MTDDPQTETPDVLPDDKPDLSTPDGRRLALFMEIVKEHKPLIELRMSMEQEIKEVEEWDHENMRPKVVKQPTGGTKMMPQLVLVRVRKSEQEPLVNWIRFLVKSKLGEDYEPEIDSRYSQ